MLYIPPEKTRRLLFVMNLISVVTLISMMTYVLSAAGGGGPLLSAPAKAQSGSQLGWAIVQGITTVIGGIAVGLTNQADYSRFARKPGDQIFGQWFSILTLGTILPLFGCLTSSASIQLYGEAYWNPPDLLLHWLDADYNSKSRAAAFFGGCGLVVCQLAINTIDNAFSAGMDLAGLFPKYFNIRRGAYLALVISIAMCPWELLSSAGTFISVMGACKCEIAFPYLETTKKATNLQYRLCFPWAYVWHTNLRLLHYPLAQDEVVGPILSLSIRHLLLLPWR